jgi:hypothetical protein
MTLKMNFEVFLSSNLNHLKMVDVETSEVDTKLSPVNVEP